MVRPEGHRGTDQQKIVMVVHWWTIKSLSLSKRIGESQVVGCVGLYLGDLDEGPLDGWRAIIQPNADSSWPVSMSGAVPEIKLHAALVVGNHHNHVPGRRRSSIRLWEDPADVSSGLEHALHSGSDPKSQESAAGRLHLAQDSELIPLPGVVLQSSTKE